MSCVVALKAPNGCVVVGADSAASDDQFIETRNDPKLFVRGKYVIGCVNSARASQLLRYSLVIPRRRQGCDLHRFIATQFVDATYECLKARRCLPSDDTTNNGNQYLVATDGHVFRIDSDYAVAEVSTAWDAIGSGAESARGALLAQEFALAAARRVQASFEYSARSRVLDALRVAAQLTSTVRKPFVIIEATT